MLFLGLQVWQRNMKHFGPMIEAADPGFCGLNIRIYQLEQWLEQLEAHCCLSSSGS